MFDPVNNNLYSAIKGLGATLNGGEMKKSNATNSDFSLVVDQSFFDSRESTSVTKKFESENVKLQLKNIGNIILFQEVSFENSSLYFFITQFSKMFRLSQIQQITFRREPRVLAIEKHRRKGL